ncbi:MAG TPA: hypothetical protein VL358_15025 [Caulobacteraceae bacterium]|jgi:hypothetical protein|nr:hypothetical protein [Caulobacteraceae bacterium]
MSAFPAVLALSIVAVAGVAGPAQAQRQPQAGAQTQAPAAAAASAASSVAPVTVQPQTQPQGRVVSSTDAASMTSPNYSAGDAEDPPRAVSLGGAAAAGVQAADSAPLPGLPASMAGAPKHSDVGVTTVF